jgi:hypothetical protein
MMQSIQSNKMSVAGNIRHSERFDVRYILTSKTVKLFCSKIRLSFCKIIPLKTLRDGLNSEDFLLVILLVNNSG